MRVLTNTRRFVVALVVVLSVFGISGQVASAKIQSRVSTCTAQQLRASTPLPAGSVGSVDYYNLLVTNVGKVACTLRARPIGQPVSGTAHSIAGPPAVFYYLPGSGGSVGLKGHTGQAGVRFGFANPTDLTPQLKCGRRIKIQGVLLTWGRGYRYYFPISNQEVCSKISTTRIGSIEAEYSLTGF